MASASAAASSAFRSISAARTAPATRKRCGAASRPTAAPSSYFNVSVPGAVLSRAIVDLALQLGQRRSAATSSNAIRRSSRPGTTHLTIFVGGNDANIIGSRRHGGRRRQRRPRLRGCTGSSVGRRSRRARDRESAPVPPTRASSPTTCPTWRRRPTCLAADAGEEHHAAYRHRADRSVNALTSRNVLVVDLMCDARILQASSFSSDGFHPGDAGYALMAELAYPGPRERRGQHAIPLLRDADAGAGVLEVLGLRSWALRSWASGSRAVSLGQS